MNEFTNTEQFKAITIIVSDYMKNENKFRIIRGITSKWCIGLGAYTNQR
jgi:hypothetical protein